MIITQAGENFSLFFEKDYREILGLSLDSVLGEKPLKKLKQCLDENQVFTPEEIEVNNKK